MTVPWALFKVFLTLQYSQVINGKEGARETLLDTLPSDLVLKEGFNLYWPSAKETCKAGGELVNSHWQEAVI